MNLDMFHPADQLMMFMERIYQSGLTTTSGGNISIKDDEGDIWITPAGVDKGSLTRDDMVCVKPDGTKKGLHKPSSEFPFHQLIYQARPDLKAIVHAHPPALVAFSIVRKAPNTKIMANVYQTCGEVAIAKYGLPGSNDLGEKIAAEFKKGYQSVILENHGVVVGDDNLFDAFKRFETLDFSARIEAEANRMAPAKGLDTETIAKHQNQSELEEFVPESYSIKERELRAKMCSLIHRAYKQKLFTSTQGTFSQRLTNESFLITPYDIDRHYLEPSDIVRIEDGKRERGKVPSRSARLHQYIYEKHPHIESIILAHPPHVMAFAVTDAELDSKTIPESYILMRDIPKLPAISPHTDPEKVADVFTPATPIAIVENECVIVTGSDLLNAFDRLEVADYSARALIASKDLGDIVQIDDQSISELEQAFGLPK
ncbi:class II aldolase/adducin family protein [Gracilibacillus salinarum]|uniref:Class II aldolase/adducin family protein n=1 Tax=Gracilibacillus salinarum TaxID=2932255 RepID=A0ABY4GR70_9BACI|nr:class II aldolase/adducin family protein [Gracilibacillus salinarum]UOQ86465.1 class II aldolase/adducin family protein [Gracilibacillus salinarum]